MHKDSRALEGLPAERVMADLGEPQSLVRAFDGVEVVYHLAASISLERRQRDFMMRTNVEGTANVLSACRAAGVRRLVHFSSIEALSDQGGAAPTVETNPLAERDDTTAYGWSKACAETLVLEAAAEGLEAVILNPTAIIGPYDFRPSALGRALISLAQGRLPLLVHGGFNWVDVRDVVEAALAAEQLGTPGERYLVSGTWMSLPDLASLVDEATDTRTGRGAAPLWAASVGAALLGALGSLNGRQPVFTLDTLRALSKHRHISSEKARTQLGYGPRALQQTVPETIAWFREQGYLPDSDASAVGAVGEG